MSLGDVLGALLIALFLPVTLLFSGVGMLLEKLS